MRHLCIPLAFIMASFGQILGADSGYLMAISEVGALAVLAAYLWYETTRARPRLTKEFREECQEGRDHSERQLNKVVDEMAKSREAVVDLQIHCAKKLS